MAFLKIRPVLLRLKFVASDGSEIYAKEYIADGEADLPTPQVGQFFEIFETPINLRCGGVVADVRQYLEIDNTSINQQITILCKDSTKTP